MDVSIISIGFNKGAKRVWLQGNMLSISQVVNNSTNHLNVEAV